MEHVETYRLLRSVLQDHCLADVDMIWVSKPQQNHLPRPNACWGAHIFHGPMHTEIDVICAFDGKIMICKNDDQEQNSHGSPPVPPEPHNAEVPPI